MSQERDECSVCGRSVGTYIPKGGDGSMRLAMVHKPASGLNDRRILSCMGSKEPTQHFGGGANA